MIMGIHWNTNFVSVWCGAGVQSVPKACFLGLSGATRNQVAIQAELSVLSRC